MGRGSVGLEILGRLFIERVLALRLRLGRHVGMVRPLTVYRRWLAA